MSTQHFTSFDLAYDIASKALSQFRDRDPLSLRICDPACGEGVFFDAITRYLVDTYGVSAHDVRGQCLYGLDIDPAAVQTSQKHASHVQCSDALCYFDWSVWPKFDLVIGNPPFLGGNKISGLFGPQYLKDIKKQYPGVNGTADINAYFLRLASRISKPKSIISFINTNTICQGDTRRAGLQVLVNDGWTIFDAVKSAPWPGDAKVSISIVHLSRGLSVSSIRLDGHPAEAINSRLRSKPERPDPKKLVHNANLSYVGSYVLGMGFTLTPEERDQLIARNPKNAERIFPYIGGEEVNTSPTQSFHRYVINFGQMSLEEASEWPDLIQIIRLKVKPERDKLRNNADGKRYKQTWWIFGRTQSALYQSIQDLPRCLVTAQVTKHLCFSFQPVGRIFSQKLIVFPINDYARFALLQSRIHDAWTWLLSSTMRSAGLNYSATDCFENFPFPEGARLTEQSRLERIGRRLYEARAGFMVETGQGLTKTYNALKDPDCGDPRVERLRGLHEEMDRVVLAAYGWGDISVPAYGTKCPKFENEIIDRLFELNDVRHKNEQKQLILDIYRR